MQFSLPLGLIFFHKYYNTKGSPPAIAQPKQEGRCCFPRSLSPGKDGTTWNNCGNSTLQKKNSLTDGADREEGKWRKTEVKTRVNTQAFTRGRYEEKNRLEIRVSRSDQDSYVCFFVLDSSQATSSSKVAATGKCLEVGIWKVVCFHFNEFFWGIN